jgi:sterol desaturase/sphingolipid hydroxylase (fatty acid hydroxylase superfamily)
LYHKAAIATTRGVWAATSVGFKLTRQSLWIGMMDELLKQVHAFYHDFPIVLGILVFFSVLERFFPAGPQKSFKGWLFNYIHIGLPDHAASIIWGAFAGTTAAALGNHFGLGWIDLRFQTGNRVQYWILTVLLSTLIFDFFYYWFHRFLHENRFLWHVHKLHHMDEQLSATTTGRGHWLEDLGRVPMIAIPTAIVFKLNPDVGGIIGYTVTVWSVFFHSNLRIHLGRAGMFFNGPQGHRIHHSRLHQHHDKNYAAYFPIWDAIFGTYHHPARDEFPPTGVHDEPDVTSFSEALILPFRAWRNMLNERRGQRAGLTH